MTFKKNIATNPRVFYVLQDGDNNESGLSIETAKATLQGAMDAVNALSPPPDGVDPATIIVEGAGLFDETITFIDWTSFSGLGATNARSSGGNYILASNATYRLGTVNNSATGQTMIIANNELDISLQVASASVQQDGITFLEVSGTTDDSFFRCEQLFLNGDGSIGVNYTASNGEPETFLFGSITLQDDNVIAFINDPSISTARSILDVASITDIGSPTGTTAIRVIDGHLSCFVNEIIAGDAIDLQGGELSIISNCVTGDITVAVGSTLVCEIIEFTGTITNNGTITGRIGDQYFTAGVVTTSDTLTNNTLVVGNGGVDVDNRENATLIDNGSTISLDLQSPSGTGTSRFTVSDSSGALKGELEYLETSDTVEMLFTTSQFTIGAGPGASTLEFVGNDTELLYQTGGSDNAFTIDMTGGPDTNPPFIIDNGGTNGGVISFYVGGRDPEGNVTADPGSIYYRQDGVDSRTYQFEAAATGNTGWVANQGNVDGPGSSVDTALATWDGVSGTLLQSFDNIRATDDGANLEFVLSSPMAGGNAGTVYRDDSFNERLRIQYDDNQTTAEINFQAATNEINSLNDLDITAGGSLDLFASDEVRVRSTNSDIILQLDTTTAVVDIVATNHDDQDTVLRMASSEGAVDFIIGEDTPVGTVSATGGSYYFRDNELDSNLFIKKSSGAASTTGWRPTVTTDGTASTNTAIAYFNSTSADSITDDTLITIKTSATETGLTFESPGATNGCELSFLDSTTATKSRIFYDENTDRTAIDGMGTGGLDILSANTISMAGTSFPDTTALIQLVTTGTNGGVTDIHCGDRSPEGNVNADPGSLYFRSNGVSSDIYIHRASSAGTTGWVDVLSTGLKTNLVSSVNEAMVIWDGTDASTVTQDSLILSVSSASAGALEILSPSASGFAGITFENSLSNTVFNIIFNETNNSTAIESGNGGDLNLFSAAQMNINTGDDIIISANSNANSVTINADFVFNGTAAGAEFDIECPAADEFAFIQFQNASSAARMQIGYDQDVDQASIQTFQTSTDFLIRSHDQPVEIGVNTIADSPSVRISNTQYSFDIYSVLNDPQGSISATEGDIAVGANGVADSFIFFNKGSSSNASWAIVELQQKAFEFVGTTSTLSQSRNRVLLNPVAGDITLSLPTAGTASRQNGFEQTLTKTITNTDVITIDTPGFYGHTGNFVMSKRGDTVTYLQDNSANVILYTNRKVFGVMERTGGAENSIGGATGADIVLDGFNTDTYSYEGLCTANQANDRFVFDDVENLTDGDLYELELNLVCRWTNNSTINFKATVDDSGISTNYNIVMESQSVGTVDEVTLFGKTFIRTGTNDALSLDTSVQIEFTLITGATLFFKQAWWKLTKIEGE